MRFRRQINSLELRPYDLPRRIRFVWREDNSVYKHAEDDVITSMSSFKVIVKHALLGIMLSGGLQLVS